MYEKRYIIQIQNLKHSENHESVLKKVLMNLELKKIQKMILKKPFSS